MATISISREFGNEGLLRGIIIEVDKKRCAKVGLNGRAECSITSSRHSIRARMDRVKSSPIEIMVKDGDLVGFVCRSTSAQILLRRTCVTAQVGRLDLPLTGHGPM